MTRKSETETPPIEDTAAAAEAERMAAEKATAEAAEAERVAAEKAAAEAAEAEAAEAERVAAEKAQAEAVPAPRRYDVLNDALISIEKANAAGDAEALLKTLASGTGQEHVTQSGNVTTLTLLGVIGSSDQSPKAVLDAWAMACRREMMRVA